MGLESALSRIERQLEEQEIAEAVEHSVAHIERHGWPVDAEGRARLEAFERYERTRLSTLDPDELIQRAAFWWAPRLDVSVEEYTAAVKQHLAECPLCWEACEKCPREWLESSP